LLGAFERETGGFMGEGLFSPWHILLIIGIALLLFGPSKAFSSEHYPKSKPSATI
jgi:hypothetical protein